ncbi:MAG TPA: peptide-binding protein [Nitrospirae bacterium]|nr:oligopeptide-binding protein AppA precursor [bacterium BMS3Abin10]GBE38315.1 oligopeptide-binding protein AppA precursor [bacterium BMS3Bbin08]HDK81125.1 peptide-binding protein [Nitrospirota bacterium]
MVPCSCRFPGCTKKTYLIYLVFLISIIISGCRGGSLPDTESTHSQTTSPEAGPAEPSYHDAPAYGDALIEAMGGRPSVLIPMLAGDSASHSVAGLIFNGLVKYDTDLSVIGDLAESWDISSDGLVITFHLRKGVKWTDGVEFTAQDVMFGYKTIIDEKTPTPYKEDFLQVKKAEVLDKYTFRVTYDKPFAPALTTWGSLVVLPKHLLEGKDLTKVDFGRNPIGLGPYKFRKWTPGQEVVLDSNRDYFEGRPYIDRYIFKIIPDPATMFLELQAGSIDMMALTPTQYTKQTDTDLFKRNFQKFRYPVFSYTYLGFNLKHPWFRDKRVRQAVAYAIDKNEIVDVVLFGLGRPATGPFVPDTWAYNPDVKKYEYDPDKARALLKEAGWADTNANGIVDKNGKDFEFTVLTNMGNQSRIKTATIIQYRLKKIGIKTNIRVLEWSTFINEFIDKRRFEAVLLGWSLDRDPDQYIIWHSDKTGEKEFNFVSYSNKEVDKLLEKGRRTFDIEERKKAYFRFQEILAEELPYIFLYVPDALPIVHSRFRGIRPTTIGIGYNLHQWYVPKNLQRYSIEQ